MKLVYGLFACSLVLLSGCDSTPDLPEKIDREALVKRHNPKLTRLDPTSPFTIGNGRFAFTADVSGLQSFPEKYFAEGIPLETKARWAWHSRENPAGYSLEDAMESYPAYGREVNFPSRMDNDAAQWLRKNPHDLPLARIGFSLDGSALPNELENIQQELDLWRGVLQSQYELKGEPVQVRTFSESSADALVTDIQSPLLKDGRLALEFYFPRGYDLNVKNTPDIEFTQSGHQTSVIFRDENKVFLQRNIDDAEHLVSLQWHGRALFVKKDEHHFRLISTDDSEHLQVRIHFSKNVPQLPAFQFANSLADAETAWKQFWLSGAAVDFTGSTSPLATELERRIVLSRYLLAVQARAEFPAQESGLTHSSWYGKHHSEMLWWHTAHWTYWGNSEYTRQALNWYKKHLTSAKKLAASRGLNGARWAKMIGPDNRESPGGNPLIIWNQPHVIHLAEMLYQSNPSPALINDYAQLVEETAEAMVSMLVWEEEKNRFNLDAPIWIAQEIYDPRQTRNPTFELAYWRSGLELAQTWRTRRGLKPSKEWQQRLDYLAALPIKEGKYVAIESLPDTFDKVESRADHPSMLAAFGLLADKTVDKDIMLNTLQAVLDTWDWETKIWGWDYPMIAMTAARLGKPELAVEVLLMDKTHNLYLNNGHVPQAGSGLRVYLPANGALLSAVGMMLSGWEGAPDKKYPGFPDNDEWFIRAEGF